MKVTRKLILGIVAAIVTVTLVNTWLRINHERMVFREDTRRDHDFVGFSLYLWNSERSLHLAREVKRRSPRTTVLIGGQPAARTGDATFFSPSGSVISGASTVSKRYAEDAKGFATGSDTHFEIIQMAASDGIAYWVGYQRAMAKLRGKDEAVPFDLRVTEIYRREGDNWKLVHRHADGPSWSLRLGDDRSPSAAPPETLSCCPHAGAACGHCSHR